MTKKPVYKLIDEVHIIIFHAASKHYCTPNDLVLRCQVSRCPPLLWSRVVQSHEVRPHNFDGHAMSVLSSRDFSVPLAHCS